MSQKNKEQNKKRIAVFFGGRSPEHDVSVVTGLQILSALDPVRYEAFPVYVSTQGEWLIGDVLRERANYMLKPETKKQTQSVTLDVAHRQVGRLLPKKTKFFGTPEPVDFDVALLAFHGLCGENGEFQGIFETCGLAYTGARTLAGSIYMDKVATKRILNDLKIPHLPYAVLKRPDEGYYMGPETIKDLMGELQFPCILKPSHLGSSIGVAKVETYEDVSECLPAIFESDEIAILEPFVQNMVEYNVAVANIDGEVKTSAIERPKATEELLDFKQKYLSGGDNKSGNKLSGTKTSNIPSEGMLSLTRELNPKLDEATENNIRAWSAKLFAALNGTGAPRIDFIGNKETGEIWMNEINPIPGSYGYFLWEAAKEPLLFSELLTGVIEEAILERRKKILPKEPVPKDAQLFKRA